MLTTKYRVLVVDDHPIVVEGYRQLINRQTDLEVVAVASSAPEALIKVAETHPHLVVVDLVLKESSGLDLIKDLHGRYPEMKLLVVSARDERVFADRALHAGAMGYVSKAEATGKLIEAIHQVLAGKVYLSEEMTSQVLLRTSATSVEVAPSPVERLSDRELEAFELIGRGLKTREIAVQMNVSPKTVDRYRENIKDKLFLPSANELLRRATLWLEQNR